MVHKKGDKMDSIDSQILELLQKNARMSIKNIADKIGLTSPAVSKRIKKLEDNNVILGYKTIVNVEKLGKKYKAFIRLSLKSEDQKKFKEFIEKEKEIIKCYHVTGRPCIVVKCLCNDIRKLNNLIEKLQYYGDTNTYMILSVLTNQEVIKK